MKLSTPAVLFDFDGVLVDSTPAVIRNWDAFAARHGYGPGDAILPEHGRRAREKIQAFRDEHRLDFSVDDETEWFNQLE
ncbi:MAG: HAD family hydrolase, partial [Candidatus Dormibacteraceae bacterium]